MAGKRRPFIVAEITSVEQAVSERQKRYTTYIIHIHTTRTTTRDEWFVDRRYSKFYDLRVLLEKKFKNAAGLPTLPKKRYMDVFNPDFLQHRRVALQRYLDELLSRPVEISLSEEVCLFLEVPEALRLHFLEMDDMIGPQAIIKNVRDHSIDRTEGHKNDGCKVTEFLNQMEEAPNSRASTMLYFKKTVMTDMPQWDENKIRLLYLGKENRGGLLAEVGAFDHSAVSSMAALSLLSLLVSSLFCIEAPASITVLRKLDFPILQMMQLSMHIHAVRSRDNRRDAYNVLKALNFSLDKTQQLLDDDWAFSEYRTWIDGVAYKTQELRTIHVSCEIPRVPTQLSRNVHDHSHDVSRFKEYAKLEEEIANELRSCFTHFDPFTSPMEREENKSAKSSESWGGWRVAPTPEELEEYDVRLDYHKFSCSADGAQWPNFGFPPATKSFPSWMIRLKLRLPTVSCVALMSLLKDHRAFLQAAIAEKAESLSEESLDFLEGIRQNYLFPNMQTTKVHEVHQSTYGADGYSEVIEVTVRREKFIKSRRVLKFMCSNVSPWIDGYLFGLSSLPTGCQACRSNHDILPSGLLIVPARAHRQPSVSPKSPVASPTNAAAAAAERMDAAHDSFVPPKHEHSSDVKDGYPYSAHARLGAEDSYERFSLRCSTFDDGRFSSWDEAVGDERGSSPMTAVKAEGMLDHDAPTSAMRRQDSEVNECATGCDVVLLSTVGQHALGLISDDLLGEMGCFWSSLAQILSIFKQLGPLPADFDPANYPNSMATLAS